MNNAAASYTLFIDAAADDNLTMWQPVSSEPLTNSDEVDEIRDDFRATINDWAINNGESGLFRARIEDDETGEVTTSETVYVRSDDNDAWRVALDTSGEQSRTHDGTVELRRGDEIVSISDGVDEDGHPWRGFAWSQRDREGVYASGWADTPDELRGVLAEWSDRIPEA